jgi:hypothetical protein
MLNLHIAAKLALSARWISLVKRVLFLRFSDFVHISPQCQKTSKQANIFVRKV